MDTTHLHIVEYWSSRKDECSLSIDWAEASKRCWRCTGKRKLQRCHVVPRSLGGSEEPENLVLLCGQCHSEAPNVADPNFMWVWLSGHAIGFYGSYWYERGFREYELIYGKTPLTDHVNTPLITSKIINVIEKRMAKTSVHWGQGKINPATVAWLIRQAELGKLEED